MHRTVLSIAGSDPCGGAGIQADMKTMAVLGVYGAAALTCITVQNSNGVARVVPLSPDLVAEQIRAVLADHQVTHIKIGMVGTAAIADAISSALETYRGEVIYDPVLTATTGEVLGDASLLPGLAGTLLPRATVLTPNHPELAALTGCKTASEKELFRAAGQLFTSYHGLRSILLTGGHGQDTATITDRLLQRNGGKTMVETMDHPRIRTANLHGTGCTLSSAFAAHLALGQDDITAFRNSVAFLQQLLQEGRSMVLVKKTGGSGSLPHHLYHR